MEQSWYKDSAILLSAGVPLMLVQSESSKVPALTAWACKSAGTKRAMLSATQRQFRISHSGDGSTPPCSADEPQPPCPGDGPNLLPSTQLWVTIAEYC